MIQRQISEKAKYLLSKFPILTITGPRQSGKTTLIKYLFKDFEYFSLENPDIRLLINDDPKGFLNTIKTGIVLDEVQKLPEFFSYIQTYSDENPDKKIVLSGSQNFGLIQSISQSLAGRTAILKLLPFSVQEINTAGILFKSYEEAIFKGAYPRLYDKNIKPQDFYPFYIQTYIERDVRQIKNITNLNTFLNFIKLCAGRIGTLLNLNSLANDAGISINTVKSWLSVLEASYIIYKLAPYHKNYNKRIVKMPKLYFYDTGLACSLLGLENINQLKTYYKKGDLFENLVINELLKNRFNAGKNNNLFFWRDSKGNEIDCIFEKRGQIYALEIKSSSTYKSEFFKNIGYWNKISKSKEDFSFLIYTGKINRKTKFGHLFSWENLSDMKKLSVWL